MELFSDGLDPGPTLATIVQQVETVLKLQTQLYGIRLPKLDPINTDQSVFRAISAASTTAPIATIITKLLLTNVRKKNGRIDTLRATPVYVSSDDGYLVVEWTETDNSKNLAIFHIEDQKACILSHQDLDCGKGNQKCVQCRLSWLMSSIIKTPENGEKYRFTWSVCHLDHIRLLFRLAQHLSGVSQWSNEDKWNPVLPTLGTKEGMFLVNSSITN